MTTTETHPASPSDSSMISGFTCKLGEARLLLKLPIRFGELADFREDDGEPLSVIAGPDADAAEVYLVVRNTDDKKRPRDAVVMLGFSSPALARAVFFAQAKSPGEYNRMSTWKAPAYLALLQSESSDEIDTDEDEDEDAA